MIIVLLFLLVCLPLPVSATTLSDAADGLSAKGWVEITTSSSGIGDPLETAEAGNYLTEFANSASWDPIRKRLYFVGHAHGNNFERECIQYADSTNTWTACTMAPGAPASFGHAYGYNTIDPNTGTAYYMHYGQKTLREYNPDTDSWTSLTPDVPMDGGNCCRVQEYFPELGGVVLIDPDWGIWLATRGSGSSVTWTCLGNSGAGGGSGCSGSALMPNLTGGNDMTAAYSAVRRVMVVCDDGACYRLGKRLVSGSYVVSVEALDNPPLAANEGSSVLTTDPVSGNFLLINGTSMRELNPCDTTLPEPCSGSGSWSTVSTTVPTDVANASDDGAIEAPIINYGVILFPLWTGSVTKVYVYKHTASTAADRDFIQRADGAGVYRSFTFDTSADIPDFAPGVGNNHCWGCNYGVGPNGNGTNIPTLDTSIKASGAGAMKFTQPEGGGSGDAGNWVTNLSPDKTFQLGEGEEMYFQFRVRMSTEMLTPANFPSSDGNKVFIISSGDNSSCSTDTPNTTNCPGSCTELELVGQNGGMRGFLQTYGGCSGPESFAGFEKTTSGTIDFHPNWTGTPTRNCLFPGPYAEPDCFMLVAGEWLTVQVYIKVVNWRAFENHIKVWLAHEGEPSQLLVDCTPGVSCRNKGGTSYTTGAYFHNDGSDSQQYGKIWLLPYQTNLASAEVDAYQWYDELIISRNKIADPGFASSGAPASPGGLTLIGVNCQGCKLQ